MESLASEDLPMSPSTFSSSSKTGSQSGGSTDGKVSVDLAVDNSTTPIDMDCQIQAQRITKILNEIIYKTKLAICLPDLVADYKTLSNVLSAKHMNDLIYIFEHYDNPMYSSKVLDLAALEDIKSGNLSLKSSLNPEMGLLMYILNYYPQLQPTVEHMTEKKRLSQNNSTAVDVGIEFLVDLEQFRSLMITQVETTAAKELAVKINTRKLETANGNFKENIEKYSKALKEENEAFEETMLTKAGMISKLEQELLVFNYEAMVKLKKKILDSERQMVLASRAHAVKQEMLLEEEAEYRNNFQALLRDHLIEEKKQRLHRLKVETQLQSWLQKYDLEMGDKQVELDEFGAKYEEEVKLCEELQKQLDIQDIEYIPLMEEREEEYHKEMTEKMQKFLVEHAARVIQNAWRQVLANRAEKKKLKKILKKVIAQKELEEARQEKAARAAEKAAKAAEKAAAAAAKKEAMAAKMATKAAKAAEAEAEKKTNTK